VESIIQRYSNFVGFPIELNGNAVNTIRAIWARSKSELTATDYEEFYKFIGHDIEPPLYRFHFSADAPLAINALLFVPKNNMEKLGMPKIESEVHLYCRKILIQSKSKGLLPDWLRFLRGVVDSEDLPLNISRETMQDSALLQKLNRVLTGRFLKFLEEEAKTEICRLLQGIRSFSQGRLIAAERAEIALEAGEKKLDDTAARLLCNFIKESLGDKVGEVRLSARLVDSPAVVVESDKGMTSSMRRILKHLNRGAESPFKHDLEINPNHPMLIGLEGFRQSRPEVSKQVAEQIYDNALIAAGLLEDPQAMLKRINSLLEQVVTK
jgi:HSP90 family molecular chaperone